MLLLFESVNVHVIVRVPIVVKLVESLVVAIIVPSQLSVAVGGLTVVVAQISP